MSQKEQLKEHLKNFTVKELKSEIMKFKKQFAVSRMKRHLVELVILHNYESLKYLLNMKKHQQQRKRNLK